MKFSWNTVSFLTTSCSPKIWLYQTPAETLFSSWWNVGFFTIWFTSKELLPAGTLPPPRVHLVEGWWCESEKCHPFGQSRSLQLEFSWAEHRTDVRRNGVFHSMLHLSSQKNSNRYKPSRFFAKDPCKKHTPNKSFCGQYGERKDLLTSVIL